MAQAFEGYAADREDVGCHEGNGREREHSVEGDGAADVNQGQSNRKGAGKDNTINGDMPGFVNLRKPN